jgi:hypothetical protein
MAAPNVERLAANAVANGAAEAASRANDFGHDEKYP